MSETKVAGIRQYLENVYKLERAVYLQESMCNVILRKKRKYQSWKPQPLKDVEVEEPDMSGVTGAVFVVCMLLSWLAAIQRIISGHFDLGLIYLFGGVFLSCFLSQHIGEYCARKKYEKLLKKEERRIDAENKNIELMNDVCRKDNAWAIAALDREYAIAAKQLKQTKDILENLYDRNIIFPKYRNLIAVSSFYEYFCSRRCDSLTGHEGAYNIFENEIRQDRIIQKLDEAVRKLDRIEKNQYMLYNAVCDVSRSIEKLGKNLDDSLSRLDGKLDSINNNTYITSYNSERQLENSRFQTFLAVNYMI